MTEAAAAQKTDLRAVPSSPASEVKETRETRFGYVLLLLLLSGLALIFGWDTLMIKSARHGLATAIAPATTVVIDTRPAAARTQGIQTGSSGIQQGQPSPGYVTPKYNKPALVLYKRVVVGSKKKYDRRGRAYRVPVYGFRRI